MNLNILKNNGVKITIKLITIFFLLTILLIPQTMINELVWERKSTQSNIIQNIASQIGASQDIIGPFLVVPYKSSYDEVHKEGDKEIIQTITTTEFAYFSAETLDILSESDVTNKKKSIYEVPFFQSENKLNATFQSPNFEALEIKENQIIDEPFLIIGIKDFNGLTAMPTMKANGETYLFKKNNKGTNPFYSKSVVCSLPDNWRDGLSTSIQMNVRGTETLNFASTAKQNLLTMNSNWPDPNFETELQLDSRKNYDYPDQPKRGNTLPTDYTIYDDNAGFTAKWEENEFGFDQPTEWLSGQTTPNFTSNLMGTNFLNVTNNYSKVHRSVKYMALICSLIFLSFFLIELLKGSRIHPFQYIMVGSAIAIFFVLLLAISEYLGFNLAYLIASISTILLITMYSFVAFKNKSIASSVGALLIAIFSFIYVLLAAKEFSLLIGAIGLFVILAVVMFATRNVEWYNNQEAELE